MLCIAYCDDNHNELSDLCTLLSRYQGLHAEGTTCEGFVSPLELVEHIRTGAAYDVIVLDVLMPGMTGIQAATEIRKHDTRVKIIFLTSSQDFAVDSYAVKAYYYLLKPARESELFPLLDRALADFWREQTQGFIVRCESTLVNLPVARFEYCATVGRLLHFHLTDGTVLKSTVTFTELAGLTKEFVQLIRPHRSYLVNMDHVFSLTATELRLRSGTHIPIARPQRATLKDEYLKYMVSKITTRSIEC